MSLFVVVGAGPVGRETARLLASDGHDVTLVSRSGIETAGTSMTSVALDAVNGRELAQICAGAETVFMCAMAAYHRWPTDFPPIMEGVIAAAEDAGARLVVLGNIYGYGEGAQSPLRPTLPLTPTTVKGGVRTRMWERVLTSKVPALEVRASDYIGAGAASLFTLMTLPSLLAGKPAVAVGDLDASRPWSFTKDVAKTLVAASRYTGDWGRAFHVPSPHATVRELASRFAEASGMTAFTLRSLASDELDAIGREDELMREVIEVAYLFQEPFVLDASETQHLLGVSSSSLDLMIEDTLGRSG